MDVDVFHVLTRVLGAIGALLVFLFGIWWKIESRQDQKIDESSKQNAQEHKELRDKIDSNHHSIRDRLDNIWKHLSKDDD